MTAAAEPAPRSFSGHLRLEAARSPDGRTYLARQSFKAPFHIGKGYWDGRVLQVRVINPTAGILAGDELELDAAVAPGAALQLSLPSATRVFMMESGAARSVQRFRVGADGWLDYAPEPLFPHTGAEFWQETRIGLDPLGSCCFVDSLAPGRVGKGERWAWRRLRLGLEVSVGGQVLLRERLDASGEEFGRMAAFYGMPEAWAATVVVYSRKISGDHACWQDLRALHSSECRTAPTKIADGLWVIRIVAADSLRLRDSLAVVRGAFCASDSIRGR